MIFYTYILYSSSKNLFYSGITADLDKRIQYHNNANKGFTMNGRPWIVLWSTDKVSKAKAEALEQKLKNLSRERKIIFMCKYHEGIHDIELLQSLK